MPLLIELTDEEKEKPLNDWEDIGQIMHAILKRELKVAVLPPANKKSLKIVTNDGLHAFHSIFTDGSNLLDANVEYFWVMGLRADQRLAFLDLVAIGDAVSAKVGMKESMRGLLHFPVSQMVIIHNHPSGSLVFSDDDINLTKNFIRQSWGIETPLKDHLILTADGGVNSLEKENRFDDLCQQAMIEELEARKAAKVITEQTKIIIEQKNELNRIKELLKKNNIKY